MEFETRKYQIECEDALLKDVLSNTETNIVHPLAVVPTGAGKTKIMGSFIYKLLEKKPHYNVLILSHTENILKQNHEAVSSFFPGINVGLYSAGLDSRTIEKITVAGIQSAFNHTNKFKKFNIVIIDEAHAIPTTGDGMYRKFFKDSKAIRVGLTATHFRVGHGLIHEGKGRMFNTLSYDLSSMENFNKLISDGYLTNLISKSTDVTMDTEGIKKSAGDFNQKALSEKFDRQALTCAAVEEIIRMGHNYRSWLIFAIDIAHADSITDELIKNGIDAEALHSQSEGDRHEVTKRFINRELRCIVSVGMVTTGFDAPNVDLLVLLRPTMSQVLHIQMIGRGLRICKGKDHCLVLDFAGNIERLGPINNVRIPRKKGEGGGGEPITKRCPVCGCIYHPTVKICDACGHKFEFIQKLTANSASTEVVQKTASRWVQVDDAIYAVHEKDGSPDSLKVTYQCGYYSYHEYICYNHSGYAKHKANHWVNFRWTGQSLPLDVNHLYRLNNLLKKPIKLLIDTSSKYATIKDMIFE